MTVEKVLEERGATYGSFDELSNIAQSLKEVMQRTEGWKYRLSHTHMEALDLIATKIARILSGDPYYPDNWVDIEGYAKLGNRERT